MSVKKKGKYFYNPELMQYESVHQTIWQKTVRLFSFLVISFLIAAVYYFAYSLFFDTPAEYALTTENTKLKNELDEINKTYNTLNKVVENLAQRDTNIYRAIFEANPLQLSSLKNNPSHHKIEHWDNNKLIYESGVQLSKVSNMSQQIQIQLDSLNKLFIDQKEALNFIPAIQPVENKNLLAAAASIGHKINPFFKSLRMHTGLDFAVPVGSKVMATADGTVKEVWYSLHGAGNRIVIDHGNDYETRYLYLNEISVKKGVKVKRGQTIGRVGNLGMTVPHLHYEVRKGGKIADPLHYFFLELTPSEYQQIIAISLNNGQALD